MDCTVLKTSLEQALSNQITGCTEAFGELTITVAPKNVLAVMKLCRDHTALQFNELIDVCGVDYLQYGVSEWATDESTAAGFSRGVERSAPAGDAPHRFAVVYHLLSLPLNQRLRVMCYVDGEPPVVPSVQGIWASASWFEREAFDMFGILFEDHPDLRRILTDYGFRGHPFRKDFPLSGEVEVRYDASLGRVVYEPVSIEERILVPKVIR